MRITYRSLCADLLLESAQFYERHKALDNESVPIPCHYPFLSSSFLITPSLLSLLPRTELAPSTSINTRPKHILLDPLMSHLSEMVSELMTLLLNTKAKGEA